MFSIAPLTSLSTMTPQATSEDSKHIFLALGQYFLRSRTAGFVRH
jgi:hypothetical protein